MTREETARHPTPDLITHPTGRLFIPRNPASLILSLHTRRSRRERSE